MIYAIHSVVIFSLFTKLKIDYYVIPDNCEFFYMLNGIKYPLVLHTKITTCYNSVLYTWYYHFKLVYILHPSGYTYCKESHHFSTSYAWKYFGRMNMGNSLCIVILNYYSQIQIITKATFDQHVFVFPRFPTILGTEILRENR